MDRASEGTRARRNATFKESTAPSHSSPVWLLRYIPGIISVQRLLNPISPRARKAGTEPQGPSVAPLTSASPHWRRPGSLISRPYTAPALPTIFGFISGATGAVGTLRHDRRWRQTGAWRNSGTGGHRRKKWSLPPLTCKHMPETQRTY